MLSTKHTISEIAIDWDKYRPAPVMQEAIDGFNRLPFSKLLASMPVAATYTSNRVTFSYRLYSQFPRSEVEKAYIIISGFGERAETTDAGMKGLLTDMLTRRIDSRKYALVIIGGLFSFPTNERRKFIMQGSGALHVIADGIAELVESAFPAVRTVTVSGYSLGGVMAPLAALAIVQHGVAAVDQVCVGEPNYVHRSTTRLHLLKRTARASAYRNDQIRASSIGVYIAIKKTPDTAMAMAAYRARMYRPLVRRLASMRLVARDLALQAAIHPSTTSSIQLQEALQYLARRGVAISLLHAEHSLICQGQALTQLIDNLASIDGATLQLIIIRGPKADHGIEEQRSLSTPFLVMPQLYQSTSHAMTHYLVSLETESYTDS